MSNAIVIKKFNQIDITDPFFDTLKEDYDGFDAWFEKKASVGENAYVMYSDNGALEGFLYLKRENEELNDVTPALPSAFRLKIGTFKIEAHGTKLGERFAKKIFDQAISESVDEVYVTVFPKHVGLTRLFEKYGFETVAHKHGTGADSELVMLRNMRSLRGDIVKDYPFVHAFANRKYMLAIQAEWHTQLLPDSILNNEAYDIVRDLSHTNSIHKVYICRMAVENLVRGDILIMYRMKAADDPGKAEYRSVATSICVVEDVKRASDFNSADEFIKYCGPHSVFPEGELRRFYMDRYRTQVVKFTYNAAMARRLIRRDLIEEVGLDRDQYWGFFEISDEQFAKIVEKGGVNENLIVD